MKKILCLIESIGPSGAERQISNLAVLLNKQGYEVEVAYYVKKEFFLPFLEENGVKGVYIAGATKPRKRFFSLWKYIKRKRPDTIISYSTAPSMITCALKALGADFKLIVSERNTTQQLNRIARIKFFLYKYADFIVPNSYSQGEFIHEHYPRLSSKIRVITNYLETNKFTPAPNKHISNECINLICVGRIAPQKNIINFINAVAILKKKGLNFRVDWYGQDFQNMYSKECYDLVRNSDVGDVMFFHPQTSKIAEIYQAADIFCLPSLWEGYPNVLCEAMSCGLPVVSSGVSDVPRIMEDGVNGFIFDPRSIYDMVEKIEKILTLPVEERYKMASRSREIAISKFRTDTFVRNYIGLI